MGHGVRHQVGRAIRAASVVQDFGNQAVRWSTVNRSSSRRRAAAWRLGGGIRTQERPGVFSALKHSFPTISCLKFVMTCPVNANASRAARSSLFWVSVFRD